MGPDIQEAPLKRNYNSKWGKRNRKFCYSPRMRLRSRCWDLRNAIWRYWAGQL